MLKKILIANRGEIALRIVRTCKEMGIATVAVYSSADKDSLHAHFADEAVCIGSAPSKHSYLHVPSILAAAELTGVDAVHPGYGFLAENTEFARICAEHKLKFIGPSADVIATMGDKATARKKMEEIGVPTIPGSKGVVDSLDQGKSIASEIGYPVLLKATAGGGGKGIRLVEKEADFETEWDAARNEALAAFGEAGIYIEKYILMPRHIEIQVLGDANGNVCHLSERDCSIQRRHQKLIEETPSPVVDAKLRKKMGEIAVKAASSIAYEGCGTIEFLFDQDGNFYFIEMNTRIQVEHPITEEVTKLDLIREQIRVAQGESISGKNYFPTGHSIQCRINAEDVRRGFRPSPGVITNLHFPGGHGVRVDTHIHTGYAVPPFYDSMIAKLIVFANTRTEAIMRMRRVLDECVIEGVETTLPLHKRIFEDERFLAGDVSTHFLDDFSMEDL